METLIQIAKGVRGLLISTSLPDKDHDTDDVRRLRRLARPINGLLNKLHISPEGDFEVGAGITIEICPLLPKRWALATKELYYELLERAVQMRAVRKGRKI